jgi:hypothetical protein
MCATMATFLLSGSERGSVAHELLQSKVGSQEYEAAIQGLTRRNPADDARADLARGDRSIYCVGSIACFAPGAEDLERGLDLTVHATATVGCVITGGDGEMEYRREEQVYVTAYNRAKVAAARVREP